MGKVILAGFILVILACIFPPWRVYFDGGVLVREYGFLFKRPEFDYYSLDLRALITEIVVIIVFTGIVAVLLRKLKD
jgi:hypothetical protein